MLIPLTELASSRGISKPSASINISRWTAQGAKITTRKKGKVLLVDGDAYDKAHADAATGSKSRLDGNRGNKTGAKPAYGSYAREQARKIGYEAELKRLELEERLGNLIPREDLQRATELASEAVLRSIDHAVMRVDELQEASARGGVAALRVALKGVVRDVKTRCADALVRIATPDAGPGAEDE